MISYTLEVALLLWQKFYNFFNNLVVNIKYWFIFALALGLLAQLVQSIPIISGEIGETNLDNHKKINLGRLAQLVQSTSFTPRGSGVRTPHRPPKTSTEMLEFFYTFLSFIIALINLNLNRNL